MRADSSAVRLLRLTEYDIGVAGLFAQDALIVKRALDDLHVGVRGSDGFSLSQVAHESPDSKLGVRVDKCMEDLTPDVA